MQDKNTDIAGQGVVVEQQGPPQEVPAASEGFHASPRYANYVLGVLFVVYVFNFVDRQIMSVFIGPIQAEFALSDTSVGLLIGFAFALLYTIAGIPIARWADRGSRKTIIAIGLTFWSAMTVATGLAKNVVHLFLTRVGVGLGEAAGTPPAHSLISHYFPLERRATALAIYSSAVFVGSAIAYLGGGLLREYFSWRTAFLVLGIPGILFALVVYFTVREPPRGYAERVTSDDEQPSLKETLGFLFGSPAWRYLLIGSSGISIVGYGVLMWGFEFYGRIHGLSPFEIGKWMALTTALGGLIGTIAGGRITDYLFARSRARAVIIPGLLTFMAMPLGAIALLVDSTMVSFGFLLGFKIMLNMYTATMYNTNQSLARLRMRATATAILLFALNMVGAGAGPFIVGALSDSMVAAHGVESIRYALVITLGIGAAGSLCYLLCGRHLERDLQRLA